MAKGLKLKVRKFWGLTHTFVEVTGEKLVGGGEGERGADYLPVLNKVKDTINPLLLFIFTNIIRCSRLPLSVGYFVYFKFTRVSSIVYQSLHL